MKNKQLIHHLKAKNKKDAGFIDQLKISYRPLICPFDDLLELIPEKASVFDIGCGSGMFLSLVKEFCNPGKLGGIEISKSLIENAHNTIAPESSENVNLSVFDGKEIPDCVRNYDYIFMIDVYHHIPREQQVDFLQDLFAKMAAGSYLVFKDIEADSILSYWNKIHDLILAGEVGHEPRSKDILQMVSNQPNIEVVSYKKRRMLLYPHFTLVLKKT